MRDWDPLTDPTPSEIPLPDAPLIRVIGQVRFPTILSVERPGEVAPFQEAIRGRYPYLHQETGPGIVMGLAGPQVSTPILSWRFSESGDPSTGWSVVLTKDFLAIETRKYTSRADFLRRFKEALEALSKTFKPTAISRLGIRYVDRISGPPVANIGSLIHSEILGIEALKVGRHVQHIISGAVFSLEGGALNARWGRLPPNSTFDPGAIDPIEDISWVLDLDAFTQEQMVFDVEKTVEQAAKFALRIYAFFRWAVTQEFLRYYGGKP
jgi:uncharacterized protein (TIGR04255 family)